MRTFLTLIGVLLVLGTLIGVFLVSDWWFENFARKQRGEPPVRLRDHVSLTE